jgi:hypothetical protein
MSQMQIDAVDDQAQERSGAIALLFQRAEAIPVQGL